MAHVAAVASSRSHLLQSVSVAQSSDSDDWRTRLHDAAHSGMGIVLAYCDRGAGVRNRLSRLAFHRAAQHSDQPAIQGSKLARAEASRDRQAWAVRASAAG